MEYGDEEFSTLLKTLKAVDTEQTKYLMSEEQEQKNKETDLNDQEKSELEALKEELCEIKSIMKKDKKFYEGKPRSTSIAISTDTINLLKLRKIGDESHEKTIIRMDTEAYDSKTKLRKIKALLKKDGDYEGTVAAIKRVLESKYVDPVLLKPEPSYVINNLPERDGKKGSEWNKKRAKHDRT